MVFLLFFSRKKMEMRLSKNFTLAELTATSHGKLQDAPSLEVIQNLQHLCIHVLQPLRDAIGRPVYITSGYRSAKLNARVGGVKNSYHLRGLAADIHVDNEEHAKALFEILKKNQYVDSVLREPTPNPASVANGGFAPLCGAAATPVAALKPQPPKKRGVRSRIVRGL
jgi:hypothetical protein